MRCLSLLVAGMVLSAGLPAFAQTQTGTTSTTTTYRGQTNAVPLYNNAGTQQQGATGVPVYNNTNVQPFPMQQMIAGKNAPSYDFNGGATAAYTGNSAYGSFANQNNAALEAQRAAQAAAYQQQYLNSLAGLGQQAGVGPMTNGMAPTALAPANAPSLQGQAMNNLYTNFGTTKDDQMPKRQRRVVYKERNDPLVTPPRLFSID